MDENDRQVVERAQVEQVFGLTGGELMDVAWVPIDIHPHAAGTVERYTENPVTFTYWYQGIPDYLEGPEWRPTDATFRTVCANEMFGQVPETVTDDEGTWKVVARYRNKGECECPYRNDDDPPVPTKEHPCPLCDADGSPAWQSPSSTDAGEHGYIYIGDGWAEIVYRLEEIERATPADAGCWVEGWWGQYGLAHLVGKAEAWGYADTEVIDLATRHLATMGPNTANNPEINDDEHDALNGASDEVEAWLNEHVAPEGFSFGWWEGEFFLWSEAQWEEGSY